MAIHGFFGSLGSGKDTTLNFFLLDKVKKGKKVISHVKMNIPYEYMTLEQIFNKAITDTKYFTDKILYLSEFHLIVESRRSMASVNVDFSQTILIQLSKIDCDLFYTAQLLSQIDLRIKEMQKYFYFCMKTYRLHDLTEELIQKIDWDKRIVRHPITNIPIPIDIDVQLVIQDGEKLDTISFTLPYEVIKPLFKNFDTREIIQFDREKFLKK